MPVIPLSEILPRGRFKDAGDRLPGLTPGMVLATGQSVSGKVTILLAIVHAMAAQGRPVVLLTDQPDHFEPFHPLPAKWREVQVQPNAAAWQQALQAESSTDALLVVAPLSRVNAPAAMAVSRDRWVFAALDTLAAGLDSSFVLRDMGVPYAEFAGSVRCIWSQFIVDAICDDCATDAVLSPAELEVVFPAGGTSRSVKVEVGCDACEGRGIKGRVAVSDITFITDHARPVIAGALVQGVPIALDPELHVTAREYAQNMLEQGVIGINTYREAMQRNPLLRTQNALELVKTQSVKLTSMFDSFVMSLWLDLSVLQAVADRTAAGVLVAEDDGRVRFANARARQALRAGSGLSIVDDHLAARTPRIRRALDVALGKAVGTAPAATRLELPAEGVTKADVYITPLPTVRGFAKGMRRLALVVVGGPGQPDLLPSHQDLRDYFDLTPAEARVAVLLCRGLVSKEVASELRISVHTVRSHLRALLEKTGTARQTQLIKLLSSLPGTGSGESNPG